MLEAAESKPGAILEGWAERVEPLNVGDVPGHLLEHLPDFSDRRLDRVLLPPPVRQAIHVCRPDETPSSLQRRCSLQAVAERARVSM